MHILIPIKSMVFIIQQETISLYFIQLFYRMRFSFILQFRLLVNSNKSKYFYFISFLCTRYIYTNLDIRPYTTYIHIIYGSQSGGKKLERKDLIQFYFICKDLNNFLFMLGLIHIHNFLCVYLLAHRCLLDSFIANGLRINFIRLSIRIKNKNKKVMNFFMHDSKQIDSKLYWVYVVLEDQVRHPENILWCIFLVYKYQQE